LKIFGSDGMRLIVVLIASTAITLVVTAGVSRACWDRAAPNLTPPIRKNHEELRRLAGLSVRQSGSPLLWLTTTLIVYLAADKLSTAQNRHPLANSVLLAVTLVSPILLTIGTSFPAYFAGAQFVHFLLGPATVALAVPLVRHLREVKRLVFPMLGALVTGSTSAILSAILLARAVGLDTPLVKALTQMPISLYRSQLR
jgi:LrgB-like family